MTSPSRFVAAATCVAFVASSSAALAQESYGPPLRLESDTPHTEYKVFAGKREKIPWFECAAPCTYAVPPGEYRIEASAPEMANGKTVIVVDRDTRVVTRGGSSSAKTTGLVLGIVGATAAGVGLMGAVLASMSCFDCSPAEEDKARSQANAFLVVAGMGAITSVVGWVMFAENRTHVVAEPTFTPRIVSLGVGPTTGGGATFGALGTF